MKRMISPEIMKLLSSIFTIRVMVLTIETVVVLTVSHDKIQHWSEDVIFAFFHDARVVTRHGELAKLLGFSKEHVD